MKRTRKYERVIWEKRGRGSAVSSRFIFVIALSQFRGSEYPGTWNRPGELRVVNLSDSRTRKGDATALKAVIFSLFSVVDLLWPKRETRDCSQSSVSSPLFSPFGKSSFFFEKKFLLGVKMAPRETVNNAYSKFWGDKQRALWYVMAFSVVVNRPYSRCPFFAHAWGMMG